MAWICGPGYVGVDMVLGVNMAVNMARGGERYLFVLGPGEILGGQLHGVDGVVRCGRQLLVELGQGKRQTREGNETKTSGIGSASEGPGAGSGGHASWGARRAEGVVRETSRA
jgi:hypothetical protein